MLLFLGMNEELLIKVCELKQLIEKEEVFQNVIKYEKLIEESDEVKILSYRKDIALMEYEDALELFDKNSKEVLAKQKVLSDAIEQLNKNEKVAFYNKNLAELNYFYKKIEDILFEGLK